jgi:hypothetical protein
MKLYEGNFNLYGELHRLYSQAQRASSARANMIQQLAGKLGRTAASLRAYFYDSNRVKITEVK